MHEIQEPSRESALLIGLERPGHDRWAVKDSLDELRELAESAGADSRVFGALCGRGAADTGVGGAVTAMVASATTTATTTDQSASGPSV